MLFYITGYWDGLSGTFSLRQVRNRLLQGWNHFFYENHSILNVVFVLSKRSKTYFTLDNYNAWLLDKLGSFHSIPLIKFDYQFYMWGINYIMAFRMNENGFHLNRTFTHIDKLSNAILCLEAWLRHFFTLKIHSEVSSEVMLQSNKPSAQARVSARLKIG